MAIDSTLRYGAVVATAAALVVIAAPTGRTAPQAAETCPMSHVHYGGYRAADMGLKNLPWVASAPNGAITGHLFFYGTPEFKQHRIGARIFTTKVERNYNPKILWVTRAKGYSKKLVIKGSRLDALGSFTSTYPGWGDYPSFVDVPKAGCWRITVTTGKVSGDFVFSAYD